MEYYELILKHMDSVTYSDIEPPLHAKIEINSLESSMYYTKKNVIINLCENLIKHIEEKE